jgi:hypothetical protein
MTVQTSTGMTISIAAATPATNDKAGYDALTFTVIGEVISIGEYGATQEEVTHTPLTSGIVQKFKGATNNGSLSIEMGHDLSDAGQALLLAASDGAAKFTNHSVKVTYSGGQIDAFQGLVFGYNRNPGAINSMVGSTSNIGLNTQVVDIQ